MKGTLRQKIMLIVMHRYVHILIILLLLSIVISNIIELFDLIRNTSDDTKEMIDMCDGIAIILYGFGVMLRFRDELMKYLGLYPDFATQMQAGIDALCRRHGIYFVLLGLIQEILVQLIVIPNRVLNTEGKELYIFFICLVMEIIALVIFIKLSVLLFRLRTRSKSKRKVLWE